MKKVAAMLLVAVMALSTLFGCGGTSDNATTTAAATEKEAEKTTEAEKATEAATEGATEDATEDGGEQSGAILPDGEITYGTVIKGDPSLYPNVDFSKEETIYLTLVGDTPTDFPEILDLVNEYLKPYSTKLDVTIWAWSDYKKLYSLNLKAGEKIDLIFTSPWCFMWSEAINGSFKTLSPEFLNENMPMTMKYQKPETWNGVKLDGNIIAIPGNQSGPNGKAVCLRQDLLEKYGRTELKTWNDYKEWLLDIAEKESPESGILGIAAERDNEEVWNVYREQFDTMEAVASDRIKYYFQYKEGELPTADDLIFAWNNQWFIDYCKDMKELGNAGVWSRSALTNETRPYESFAALKAASFCRGTFLAYMQQAEEGDPNAECAIYDVSMENFCLGEAYNNNDIAITSFSKNPERAAMVLDLMKMDTYLNHLLRMGIEGVHYNMDGYTYYPTEKAADYTFDTLAISWIIRNGEVEEYIEDERQRKFVEDCKAKLAPNPLEGFVFNDTDVQYEAQACALILEEYVPSLELGLFDDIEGTIAQMMDDLDKAGFQKVEDEIKRQYEAWYNSMQ